MRAQRESGLALASVEEPSTPELPPLFNIEQESSETATRRERTSPRPGAHQDQAFIVRA